MYEAIEIPLHGGGGGIGAFIVALAICVLVGQFIWKSFNEPVSTGQRFIAAALLVFLFGGIVVIAVSQMHA